MANGYVENVEKWKTLTDIDYFTYFIKAWISFNAWYRNQYENIDSDRTAINKVKNESNSIKNKAIGLLGSQSEQATQFEASLASLHKSLMELAVHNDGKRLCFYDFVVEVDRNNLIQRSHARGISYYLEVKMERSAVKEVKATVSKADRTTILNYTGSVYDRDAFVLNSQYLQLSGNQKHKVINLFDSANPFKPENLLTDNENDCFKIGAYKFIRDEEKIFKCLLEVIYGLRNALFHGEIVPNKDHRKVYEHAYHVLKILLDSLD